MGSRMKEDELIGKFRRKISERELLNLKDDSGVFKAGRKKMVATSDFLYRKTHFPEQMSYFQMGRKCIVISVSDIAAMGCKPLAATLTVTLDKEAEKHIGEIGRGFNSALKEYSIKLLKGDTKNFGIFAVSSAVIGIPVKNILTRSGAKAGDLVAVTGTLGDAACGLEIVLNKRKFDSKHLIRRAFTRESNGEFQGLCPCQII